MPEGFVEQIHPSTIHLFNITDASPACGTLSTRHTGSHASQSSAVPFATRSGRKFVEPFTLHSSSFTSKKAAFTLAEVLITLGIIGVVAAMTLPALTANSRKQEVVSRLQKFNSTMQQAVLLSVVDNGPVEYWNKESMATSDESDASDGYDFVEGSKQAEKFFKEYLGPYIKYLSLEMTDEFVYPLKLVFSDGTCAYLKNGGYIDFVFDINCNKKPNKYGYDRFYYSLSIKKNNAGKYFAPFYKTITTENWNDRNWLLENCAIISGDSSGACARLIEYDGWQIKEDYPHKI